MEDKQDTWEEPTVEDLGSAEDLIQGQNALGGGDQLFNLLAPS